MSADDERLDAESSAETDAPGQPPESQTTSAVLTAIVASNIDLSELRPLAGGEPTIPCTLNQFQAVLVDCGARERWDKVTAAFDRLTTLEMQERGRAGGNAPKAARTLVDNAAQLIANLGGAAWFIPPPSSIVGTEDLHGLARAARTVGESAGTGELHGPAVDEALRSGLEILTRFDAQLLFEATDPPTAIVAEVFKVDRTSIDGLNGLDASGRLRAATPLGLKELDELSGRILAHLVGEKASYRPSATSVLLPMLLAERPLFAHVAALHVRDLLLKSDPAIVGRELAGHQRHLPSNWATHRAIVRDLQRLIDAEANGDEEDVALAEAELAWRTTEGPLRRTAHTLLRIDGLKDEDPPTLATLSDLLAARDDEIGRVFGAAIHAEWRNAVAHREVEWDSEARTLLMRGESVSYDELRYRRAIAQAAMAGFECGVVAARASDRDLARQIDVSAPVASQPLMARSRIAAVLGDVGLIPEKTDVANGVVSVRFASGTAYEAAKAIGAISGIRHDLRLGDLHLQFGERDPLRLTRGGVDALSRLRVRGEAGRRLPAVALWPIIAFGRAADGVDVDEVYAEMARRACWSVTQDVAGLLGIPGGRSPTWSQAVREVSVAVRALQEAWRVIDGRPPPELADVPEQLRKVIRALERRDRSALYDATRVVFERTEREEPPLQWFDPL